MATSKQAALPLRVGIDLTSDEYLQLAAIARARDPKERLRDGDVAAAIVWLVRRSLAEARRLQEEADVRAANRRHIAAVPEPWPTGPWSQDEVDEVVGLVRDGLSVDEISARVYRRRSEISELLRGFGLSPIRRTERAVGDRAAEIEATS